MVIPGYSSEEPAQQQQQQQQHRKSVATEAHKQVSVSCWCVRCCHYTLCVCVHTACQPDQEVQEIVYKMCVLFIHGNVQCYKFGSLSFAGTVANLQYLTIM